MIPFPPWLPDLADYNSEGLVDAQNVLACSTGFRPFPSLSIATSAITARAQGAISVRSQGGAIFNFAGDATKLYRMDSDGNSWSDVSRSAGGAYGTASDGAWNFIVFGDYVVAINGVDAAQYFLMGTSTLFAALGGSSPVAAFGGVVRDFAVMARVSAAYSRVQWSAINDITSWATSATTMADNQDLPDGGQIMGFVGGEYGVVLQERSLQRMSFEGPPTAFRFDKISNTLGCRAERSIAAYEDMVFFLADNGFHMVHGGSQIIPIGAEKVDRYFEADFNSSYPGMISSAIDPVNKYYVMGYPNSASGTGSVANAALAFHWPTGKWTRASFNHEMIYPSATVSAWTIDGLDNASSTIDGIPYPVDSRYFAGTGRLLLSGFNTSHQQGSFAGTALEAVIETGDIQINPGRKTMFRGLRPIIEATSATPSLVLKSRDRLQDTHVSSSSVDTNANGFCPVRANARYHRAKLTVPAAATWDFFTGVDDIRASVGGTR